MSRAWLFPYASDYVSLWIQTAQNQDASTQGFDYFMDKKMQFRVAAILVLAHSIASIIIPFLINTISVADALTPTVLVYGSIAIVGILSSIRLYDRRISGIIGAIIYCIMQIIHIDFHQGAAALVFNLMPNISFSWGRIWLEINIPSLLMIGWLVRQFIYSRSESTTDENIDNQSDNRRTPFMDINISPIGLILTAILVATLISIIADYFRSNESSAKIEQLSAENARLQHELAVSATRFDEQQKTVFNARENNLALMKARDELLKNANQLTTLNNKVYILTQQLEESRSKQVESYNVQRPDHSALQDAVDLSSSWTRINWLQNNKLKDHHAFQKRTEKLGNLLEEYNLKSNGIERKIDPDELQCDSDSVVVYFSNDRYYPTQFISTACYIKGSPSNPLIFKRMNDKITLLLNMPRYSFQNKSGVLTAVTDINNDGRFELWLSGIATTCHETGLACQRESQIVVEEFNNIALLRYRN
jgi:hypothetical protein